MKHVASWWCIALWMSACGVETAPTEGGSVTAALTTVPEELRVVESRAETRVVEKQTLAIRGPRTPHVEVDTSDFGLPCGQQFALTRYTLSCGWWPEQTIHGVTCDGTQRFDLGEPDETFMVQLWLDTDGDASCGVDDTGWQFASTSWDPAGPWTPHVLTSSDFEAVTWVDCYGVNP